MPVVKKKSWIQPSAAAKYFSVSCATIRQWISAGQLRAAKLPTGHLRILARDVIKSLLRQGKPIPQELGNLSGKHVLIVDPDLETANAMAGALKSSSGCRVSVAETAPNARALLNGLRPDLVLLGVHRARPVRGGGNADMLILARAPDELACKDANGEEVAFSVSDILATPVNERALAYHVANVLLG